MSNSDYKIKYIAPSKRFAEALNSQTFIPIELNGKKALAEPDDSIFVLNALDETNIERNSTAKYRLNGKLQIVTDNLLKDAWALTPIPDTAWTPDTEQLDQSLIPRNWILQITYPFESDDEKNVTIGNDFVSKAYEGFQIKELLPFNYKSGITNILIRTAQKHGIKTIDDYVYISPKNNFISDGVDTFNYLGVKKILDFEEGNEEYGLILDVEYVTPTSVNIFGQPITVVDFLGVGKRIFEPSSNDIVFVGSSEVNEVERCDETGGQTGPLIYTKIFSTEHGLRVNDFVEVRVGNSVTNINNIYKVVATPTVDTFVIKYNFPNNNVGVFSYNLNYKYMDGVPSEYYYRKHKIITTPKDYEVYKAAYSTSIFDDSDIALNDVFLFHYDTDIDVADLRDNLGRPISNLYLTVARRAGSGASGYDGFSNFSSVSQILDNNRTVTPIDFGDDVAIDFISFWQNTDPTTAGSYKSSGSTYFGDFVEYNRSTLDEIVLAESLARFGPSQVLNDPNDPNNYIYQVYEGYTYKLHNKIKIRDFSSVIETVPNKTNEIFPDYAQVNNDNTISWRDLLEIGFFENNGNERLGVDYPFVNGKHYLFGDYPIYLRRQYQSEVVDVQNNLNKFSKFNTDSTPNDEC